MTAVNINDYAAGDSLTMDFTVRDEHGAPVILTGASAQWGCALNSTRDYGDPITTKTIDAGIAILDAAAGRLRVTVEAGDIPDPGEYYHELEVTLATGESYTPGSGIIKAKRALFRN